MSSNSSSRSIGITTTKSSIPVIFDSLPYIDTILPEYEQYATLSIEQEMQQQCMERNKLHPRVIELMQTHRHQNHQDSRKRRRMEHDPNDDLPATPQRPTTEDRTHPDVVVDETFPSIPTDQMSLEDWNVTIKKARIAYEKERIRSLELEIDKETLSESWKSYNQDILESLHQHYQQLLQDQNYQVTKINYERQEQQQTEYHPTLGKYQYQYQDLLLKINQLHNAIESAK